MVAEPNAPRRIERTERRVRGFFGKVWIFLFFAFNLLMVYGVVWSGFNRASQIRDVSPVGEKAAAMGLAVDLGILATIWFIGAVILGMGAMLTRGKKVIVTERVID